MRLFCFLARRDRYSSMRLGCFIGVFAIHLTNSRRRSRLWARCIDGGVCRRAANKALQEEVAKEQQVLVKLSQTNEENRAGVPPCLNITLTSAHPTPQHSTALPPLIPLPLLR